MAVAVVLATLSAATVNCTGSDPVSGVSESVQGADGQVASGEPNLSICLPEDANISVARLWIEANLDAIRRDFPAPTVHARNLWHVSAAMWDAFASYDTTGRAARTYFAPVEVDAVDIEDQDLERAAAEAMSYAAHGLLTTRYALSVNGGVSLAQFDELMATLCLPTRIEPAAGSPAAVGIAIAEQARSFGLEDGAAEQDQYRDPTYTSVNPPLVVAAGNGAMDDPNRWQPLELALRVTQNGQTEEGAVQDFIGSHWGFVTSFALPEPDARGVTIDPGPPPLLGDGVGAAGQDNEGYVDAAVELIQYSDWLGGESGAELIDVGPSARGNSVLGETVGSGHELNPETGEPYRPNLVSHSDFGRAVAEYWADGPDSETPPGHWNSIAIAVSDRLDPNALRWAGEGAVLTRTEWDLRLFFTMNAALHDAAIAVWGAKRAYDYPRPISMIRYLGAGNGPGLPELPGLIEVVTAESAAAGGRHVGLPEGVTAVRSWLGPVADPDTQLAGVGWRRGEHWLPYQRPTFVSPAFAAYVSGHSGFSRAAADTLESATGSAYFPGGLFTHAIPAGTFLHEVGPSEDIELQWATYQDAADEAGESRRYGGIHIAADDLAGRRIGAEIATLVWTEAKEYFG